MMRKFLQAAVVLTALALAIVACKPNYEKRITGTWDLVSDTPESMTFNGNGDFLINGTSTNIPSWRIDGDMLEIYGQIVSFKMKIVQLTDTKLVIENGDGDKMEYTKRVPVDEKLIIGKWDKIIEGDDDAETLEFQVALDGEYKTLLVNGEVQDFDTWKIIDGSTLRIKSSFYEEFKDIRIVELTKNSLIIELNGKQAKYSKQ